MAIRIEKPRDPFPKTLRNLGEKLGEEFREDVPVSLSYVFRMFCKVSFAQGYKESTLYQPITINLCPAYGVSLIFPTPTPGKSVQATTDVETKSFEVA